MMASGFLIVALVALLSQAYESLAYRFGMGRMLPLRQVSTTALSMASTADFKNGMTLDIDGIPSKIIEFLHVKPGKGSAFVRTKIKNLMNGSVQEKTFRAGESVTLAEIEKTEMQYTFTDGDSICFMNMETFEEQRIESKMIDQIKFLKEGLSCQVTIWNEQVIGVDLPQQVAYEVVSTPPNLKGATVQGGSKPAELDCGATVNVPMFIENGELILVTPGDGKYVGRSTDGKGKF